MRCLVLVMAVLAHVPAAAQVVSRPSDPPIVTAENDQWYQRGEPVLFAGDVYYRAGAAVFFNGNTMVRTGHHNGVPLYADTTLEPFSIVYVPIGGGLMQPYERLRRGDLAGTAGSRTPSFPGSTAPIARNVPVAPSAPTAPPLPMGAVSTFTPEAGAAGSLGTGTPGDAPGAVGTGGVIAVGPRGPAIATITPAESNDGVWVAFMGDRWVSAGSAVPLRAGDFVQVGEYRGFPVFARRDLQEPRIYLPSAGGMAAPFRLKE